MGFPESHLQPLMADEGMEIDTESTRAFLLAIAPKIGKSPAEVLPYILKLEEEWVLK